MGRTTEKDKDRQEDRLASLGSEQSDDEEVDENRDREETPDLYRNSALGMLVISIPRCIILRMADSALA
jgi:E3 ubiquitin-protein ligase HUWE1